MSNGFYQALPGSTGGSEVWCWSHRGKLQERSGNGPHL